MHHVVVESWSRRRSPLHARDARAKLGALLVFLIAVSTTSPESQIAFAGYAALLLVAILSARLPMTALLRRALLVLPFSAPLGIITWLGGNRCAQTSSWGKEFPVGISGAAAGSDSSAGRADARTGIIARAAVFAAHYRVCLSIPVRHFGAGSTYATGRAQPRVELSTLPPERWSVLFARSWERADGDLNTPCTRARIQRTSSVVHLGAIRRH